MVKSKFPHGWQKAKCPCHLTTPLRQWRTGRLSSMLMGTGDVWNHSHPEAKCPYPNTQAVRKARGEAVGRDHSNVIWIDSLPQSQEWKFCRVLLGLYWIVSHDSKVHALLPSQNKKKKPKAFSSIIPWENQCTDKKKKNLTFSYLVEAKVNSQKGIFSNIGKNQESLYCPQI